MSLHLIVGLVLLAAWGCQSSATARVVPAADDDRVASLEDRRAVRLAFSDSPVTRKEYWPLAEYLTPRTPYRFDVLFPQKSEYAEIYLETRIADVVELDAFAYLRVRRKVGARALARMLNAAGEANVRSVFVTCADSPIHRLRDLKGRTLGLGAPHSMLTSIVPIFEMYEQATRAQELERLEFFSDEESVLDAVARERVVAGALPAGLASRAESLNLRVFHTSRPVPSSAMVVLSDLPEDIVQLVRNAILSLDYRDVPRPGWSKNVAYGFAPASDRDYEGARRLLARVPQDCGARCHSNRALPKEGTAATARP